MYHKKSIIEQLLEVFYELTEIFWAVGAVISGLFLLSAYKALAWGIVVSMNPPTKIGADLLVSSLGYFYFLFPLGLFVVAYLFANRAYITYVNQKL